jgi:hypothetical protein
MMNVILSSGSGLLRFLLITIKAFSVLGPLVLVALVRVLGLEGSTGFQLIVIGYGLSLIALVAAGVAAASAGQSHAARSNFIFAGVSLLWLLIMVVLLPRLAST